MKSIHVHIKGGRIDSEGREDEVSKKSEHFGEHGESEQDRRNTMLPQNRGMDGIDH